MAKKTKKAGAKRTRVRAVDRQKLLASVDVFADAVVLTRYGARGRTSRSLVTPNEAADLLRDKTERVGSWALPGPSVIAWQACGDRTRLIVCRPAGVASLKTGQDGKKLLKTRLPTLVGQVEIVNEPKAGKGRFVGIGRVLCCLDGPRKPLRETSRLHACPLPNCYSDGTWCHGGVAVDSPGLNHLGAAELFDRAFVSGCIHPADHGLTGPLSDRGVKRYRDVLGLLRWLARERGKKTPAWALADNGTLAEMLAGPWRAS